MYFVLYSQIDLIDCLANAVTSGNVNVEIKNRYSSYKLLALFLPFNIAACPGMSPHCNKQRFEEKSYLIIVDASLDERIIRPLWLLSRRTQKYLGFRHWQSGAGTPT